VPMYEDRILDGDPGRYLSRIEKSPLAFKNGESIIFKRQIVTKKGICIDIAKKKGRDSLSPAGR
jgi:hypothetical protein